MTSPNYGRTVTIRRSNASKFMPTSDGAMNTPVTAAMTPEFEHPIDWTTVIKIVGIPLLASNAGPPDGVFTAIITYLIGGVSYSQTVTLASGNGFANVVRRIPGLGTKVQVDILWTGILASGSPDDAFTVSVGVAEGKTSSELYVAPAWYSGPVPINGAGGTPSDNYAIVQGNGTLQDPRRGLVVAMTGVLTAAESDGSPVYPMALDYNLAGGGLGSGSLPIPGTVGPALSSVGDSFSFSDEFDPQCGFWSGLVVALSTSPVIYLPISLGAKFKVDVKVGG